MQRGLSSYFSLSFGAMFLLIRFLQFGFQLCLGWLLKKRVKLKQLIFRTLCTSSMMRCIWLFLYEIVLSLTQYSFKWRGLLDLIKTNWRGRFVFSSTLIILARSRREEEAVGNFLFHFSVYRVHSAKLLKEGYIIWIITFIKKLK